MTIVVNNYGYNIRHERLDSGIFDRAGEGAGAEKKKCGTQRALSPISKRGLFDNLL